MSNSTKNSLKSSNYGLLILLAGMLAPQYALMEPGELPTSPLFLSTGVEPNLFFTLDNSTSMNWETTMRADRINGVDIDENGRGRDAGVSSRRDTFSLYLLTRSTAQFFPPADGTRPDWDKYWVARSHEANPMYYDPSRTYLPWPGVEANGRPMYEDADPSRMQVNPLRGGFYNLTVRHRYSFDGRSTNIWIPTYFVWTDTDRDGIVDVTDQHQRVEIPPNTPEMQNFANWYKYHRRRIDAAKFVTGTAINNGTSVRMGINMFNGNTFSRVESMQDEVRKRNLLRTVYRTPVASGTPARSSLIRTGDYFASTGGNAPILPSNQGGMCQQNFNIIMSDGAWEDETISGIGNRDRDNGSGSTPFDGNASQSNDGGNYADNWSDTLADVAMKYYESDLRTDIPNNVPTRVGVDEADHQHLVNYSVSFGVRGRLDPINDDPAARGFRGWPNVKRSNGRPDIPARIDDLWHAAYNSRGDYFEADGATSLFESFNEIVNDVASRTESASAVAVNSSEIKSDTFVYLASFDSGDWSGDISSYEIADLASGRLANRPSWRAGELLTRRGPGTRHIITYDRSNGESVPFRWNDIPAEMKADLNTNDLGVQDTNGEERLNYLRGDRSNEDAGLGFRERTSLLGDIVNSGPVYVGEPNMNWPDSAPFPTGNQAYSEFKQSHANRRPLVFVGSNDGMLHGFFAQDTSPGFALNGEEVFAYVPGMLSSDARNEGLHYLSQTNYQHRFHVDLTPTVSDAYVSLGGTGARKWRTVLVGALRGGGRGVFALDVSRQSALTEANADRATLWEFSGSDDQDLGHTYSQPVVALTNAGTWVAIFGNGYNDSGDGKPHLFVVNLDKGGDGNWVLDDDYIKIEAGDGSPTDRNGLASPALADVDGDGTVDRVYAGDLRGNMWAFDLSSSVASQWGLANGNDPVFTTPGGSAEPITGKPVLSWHPTQPDSGTNSPNLMVYFGTGRFLTLPDISNTRTQKFYGVWDRGNEVTQSQLVQQTFDSSYAPDLVLTQNAVDYTTKNGWFIELPDTGERAITKPLARGSTIFFNTYVPASDPCAQGGYGYRYAVDMATGGAPRLAPFDVNGDHIVDDSDQVSNGSGTSSITTVRLDGFLPDPVVVGDVLYTGTEPVKIRGLGALRTGRIS